MAELTMASRMYTQVHEMERSKPCPTDAPMTICATMTNSLILEFLQGPKYERLSWSVMGQEDAALAIGQVLPPED